MFILCSNNDEFLKKTIISDKQSVLIVYNKNIHKKIKLDKIFWAAGWFYLCKLTKHKGLSGWKNSRQSICMNSSLTWSTASASCT